MTAKKHYTCPEFWTKLIIWVCLKMLCTPVYPMVNDHYPYEKLFFYWEYTRCSDKPHLPLRFSLRVLRVKMFHGCRFPF